MSGYHLPLQMVLPCTLLFPHRRADLHTQSGGVHPNDAMSSPVRGRLLSEADWSERSSVLGLHLVCPAVLGPATPCAAGPVPSPRSDLPRGEPPLACQLGGASHIGSFHFPVFKSKMCSLFQYLSNYKIFREDLLRKGWAELCFIRYCFLFDNSASNPPLNYYFTRLLYAYSLRQNRVFMTETNTHTPSALQGLPLLRRL